MSSLLDDSPPPPAPSLLPPGTNWQLWAEERNRSWFSTLMPGFDYNKDCNQESVLSVPPNYKINSESVKLYSKK